MSELDHMLAEARRIAGQPTGDKLDGKQGEEAYNVILRLLESTGLDYSEALRLVGAREWEQWRAGWRSGYEAGTGTKVEGI